MVQAKKKIKLPKEIIDFIRSTVELCFGPYSFKGKTAWEYELLSSGKSLLKKYEK